MKPIIGFIFFLLIVSSSRVFAQTVFPHSQDVIVEIKNFNQEKHLEIIFQSLEQYSPNSLVKSVCNWSGWVLIRVDLDQIEGTDGLLNILKGVGLEVAYKEGATLADLNITCKEPVFKF